MKLRFTSLALPLRCRCVLRGGKKNDEKRRFFARTPRDGDVSDLIVAFFALLFSFLASKLNEVGNLGAPLCTLS